jgi:hypothetical protein
MYSRSNIQVVLKIPVIGALRNTCEFFVSKIFPVMDEGLNFIIAVSSFCADGGRPGGPAGCGEGE